MINTLIIDEPRRPLQATRPAVPATPLPFQPPQHKRTMSVAAPVVAVFFFLCLSIGVIMFTTAADKAERKNRPHEPARNIPMFVMR